MKAADWIDRVKAAKGWESDYRVAKTLGFNPNTISNYRAHGTPMDESIAIKVADALGEKPEIILVDQMIERSKSDVARTAWSTLLGQLGGAMGISVPKKNTPSPTHVGPGVSSPAVGAQVSWRKRTKTAPTKPTDRSALDQIVRALFPGSMSTYAA